ncbi:hypothetical protein ALISP_4912 [Alicycliphilus sp. B1]|nr:hypothetical protein ALISP_4912 [Alicycliphilus sp. B1]
MWVSIGMDMIRTMAARPGWCALNQGSRDSATSEAVCSVGTSMDRLQFWMSARRGSLFAAVRLPGVRCPIPCRLSPRGAAPR